MILQEFGGLFRFDFEHGHGFCTVQPGSGLTFPIVNGGKVGVERGHRNRFLDLQVNAINCLFNQFLQQGLCKVQVCSVSNISGGPPGLN